MTQTGFHPSVPAALARWAAVKVDGLHVAWVGGLLWELGGIPATAGLEELVASFRDYRALRFQHGAWKEVKGIRPSDYPVIDFGGQFGRRWT